MTSFTLPNMGDVGDMIWVGSTLLIRETHIIRDRRRNDGNRRRTGRPDRRFIENRDLDPPEAAQGVNRCHAYNVSGPFKVHQSYGEFTFGFIDLQAAGRYSPEDQHNWRWSSNREPKRAYYYLLDESKLSEDRTKLKKVAGSKSFYQVAYNNRMSRGTNVLAVTGGGLKYRDNIAQFLPSHVTASVAKTLNRYGFLLYRFGGEHKMLAIDAPVTGLAVSPDDMVVAVMTRTTLYIFDVDV